MIKKEPETYSIIRKPSGLNSGMIQCASAAVEGTRDCKALAGRRDGSWGMLALAVAIKISAPFWLQCPTAEPSGARGIGGDVQASITAGCLPFSVLICAGHVTSVLPQGLRQHLPRVSQKLLKLCEVTEMLPTVPHMGIR